MPACAAFLASAASVALEEEEEVWREFELEKPLLFVWLLLEKREELPQPEGRIALEVLDPVDPLEGEEKPLLFVPDDPQLDDPVDDRDVLPLELPLLPELLEPNELRLPLLLLLKELPRLPPNPLLLLLPPPLTPRASSEAGAITSRRMVRKAT